MAAFQAAWTNLLYDPIEDGRPSLEDRTRLRMRENGRRIAGRPLQSNALSAPMAGYKARAKTSIRGGTFAPRATSGML